MTSRQHQDWINRGKPDSGLALPLQLLANTLAATGYTVYVYPNDAHLDAEPPEDHTYYSETGWPGRSPKWWRHAIDIMPSKGGADLFNLGQRIVADRNRGLATWIKYVNVPTDATLRRAVQHRWEPGHSSGSSSDTGHIHISSITGCETLDSPYNPLLSTSGTDRQQGDPFAMLDEEKQNDLWIWLASLVDPNTPVTGRTDDRFHFPPQLVRIKAELDAIAADVAAVKAAVGAGSPTAGGAIAPTPLALSDAQATTIANSVADAVVAAVSNLSDADKPTVLNAAKQALLTGAPASPGSTGAADTPTTTP